MKEYKQEISNIGIIGHYGSYTGFLVFIVVSSSHLNDQMFASCGVWRLSTTKIQIIVALSGIEALLC